MIVIDRKAIWIVELPWLVASLAELGHERVAIIIIITREYLHSIVIVISNEQETSMMVEHQAIGAVEQAIITAFFLSADREHDSSITIKSIVSFHPSTNQPLSQRQDRKSKRCDAQAHEERREILQTQQQHQGAARRKETTKQQQRHDDDEGTKRRSSIEAWRSLSLVSSFASSPRRSRTHTRTLSLWLARSASIDSGLSLSLSSRRVSISISSVFVRLGGIF